MEVVVCESHCRTKVKACRHDLATTSRYQCCVIAGIYESYLDGDSILPSWRAFWMSPTPWGLFKRTRCFWRDWAIALLCPDSCSLAVLPEAFRPHFVRSDWHKFPRFLFGLSVGNRNSAIASRNLTKIDAMLSAKAVMTLALLMSSRYAERVCHSHWEVCLPLVL